MATAAVIGISTGKRLLRSSFLASDIERVIPIYDFGATQFPAVSHKSFIVSKKSPGFGPNSPSNRQTQYINAIKEHVNAPSSSSSSSSTTEANPDFESSLEALILLQKSMLEKQWNLSFDQAGTSTDLCEESCKKLGVISSGASARQRRNCLRRPLNQRAGTVLVRRKKQATPIVSPELLQGHFRGYVKGISNDSLLSHAEVVHLSWKIRAGLSLEEHKSRLKEKLGFDPSDELLASSLKISRSELHSKLIECSLAKEKLAMSNIRLVMSIAQKYDNMGIEMADLIQGGLIGLLRGIEKFDSSKGFKISTYVYWWIRQVRARIFLSHMP